MPPFSNSKDFRGWWSSRTGLEQKLIILSSLLFVLSFCLVISVIVINNRKPGGGGKGPDLTTTLEPITETTLNNTNTTEVTVTEPSTTEEPSTTVPSSLSEKETKSTSPAVSETSTDATTTTKPLPETTITESTTMENTSSTETNETSNTDPPKLFVDVNRSVDEKLFPQENPTGRKLLSTFSWPKTIDEEEDKDDTDLSILYFKRNSLLNRMPHSNIPRRS